VLYGGFHPYVDKQIELENRLREGNISQEGVQKIASEQYTLYMSYIEELLQDTEKIDAQKEAYDKKLYILKKVLKQSKKRDDRYTVAKNELNYNANRILYLHVDMLKNIFLSLDLDRKTFEKKLADEIAANQQAVDDIVSGNDYQWLARAEGESESLKDAQQTLRDFQTILEINNDTYSYLARYSKRIYRLEKYQQYHLLSFALFLDHSKIGTKINDILEPYDLSVIKVILIAASMLFFYFIHPLAYGLISFLLRKAGLFRTYAREIIESMKEPLGWLLLSIGLNLTVDIYSDFDMSRGNRTLFEITYTVLLTLALYRIVNAVASIRIEQIKSSNTAIKSELINVAIKIVNALVFLIGILFSLRFAGVDLTTLLSGLGIGGFAIALAARETLSNFFGTVSILMSDSYSQGDWIVVDQDEGTVVEIGLRVTTLRTFDNAIVSIPNGLIANQKIKNWNRRTLGRRIKMTLSLRYDSDPAAIKAAIADIRQMLRSHPDITTDKTAYQLQQQKSSKLVSIEDSLGVKRNLFVYLESFSSSSIDVLVYCFTKKTDWGLWLETREDVMYRIMEILRTHSLEFAFPSLSLYHEEGDEELRVKS